MNFQAESFNIFNRDWALVTAGTPDHFNTMTISWGGLGTLWGKPVATVYVKPVRYTHEFLESSDCFTVSFYPAACRRALGVLGSLSGRNCDKVAASGLTPRTVNQFITFQEAEVTLLCRKIYRQDLVASAMPEDVVSDYYETETPHTMYIGEVVDILY